MPAPANPSPDGLTPFETKLGKPRAKWSKAEWRAVAMQLAGAIPTGKPGRPALTDEQQQQKTQNLLAAEFWRDQEQESQTQPDGSVTPRKRKLTKGEATAFIVREAIDRQNHQYSPSEKLVVIKRKTTVLIRDIQSIKKDRGKNKDPI